jgi:CheY-like chemotaxis protein
MGSGTRALPVQLETALLNLAINARDAMEGRGKLTVEAANAFLDDSTVLDRAEARRGQYVMVAVSDTGCGIHPEILEKVFDPFFSTKPAGQGTGLGLSMVHGFVKQSGGHIKIYSELGRGSTVRIYLPRSQEDEDAELELGSGAVIGGSETILLVEDDENVRATPAEMLSELGYGVLRAKDVDSALVIVESGAAIDLLFTDTVMPGALQATELARKAQEKIPGIAVLFTTGYAQNAALHGARLPRGTNLIAKPYARDQLALKLRQILNKEWDCLFCAKVCRPINRSRPRGKRLSHRGRVAADDCQIGAGGGVRLLPPLLPVAQGSDRNLKPRGEFLLRKPERAPDDFRLRRPLHAVEIFRLERTRVRIAERGSVPFLLAHRVEPPPVARQVRSFSGFARDMPVAHRVRLLAPI